MPRWAEFCSFLSAAIFGRNRHAVGNNTTTTQHYKYSCTAAQAAGSDIRARIHGEVGARAGDQPATGAHAALMLSV